jgi:hypothetical protein
MSTTRERLENAFAKRYYAPGEEDVWAAVSALIAAAEEMIPAPGMVILDPSALPHGVDANTLRNLTVRLGGSWPVSADILDHLADLIAPVVTEPLGLGAVVRDGEGTVWCRADANGATSWCKRPYDGARGWRDWSGLPQPVTVLSQGWTETS